MKWPPLPVPRGGIRFDPGRIVLGAKSGGHPHQIPHPPDRRATLELEADVLEPGILGVAGSRGGRVVALDGIVEPGNASGILRRGRQAVRFHLLDRVRHPVLHPGPVNGIFVQGRTDAVDAPKAEPPRLHHGQAS